MSKRTTILLHIAIWVVVFLTPMPFVSRERTITLEMILHVSMAPLFTIVAFYANYLWLTPKYFVRNEKRIYWTVNIIGVIVLGVLAHYWLHWLHLHFDGTASPEPTLLGHLFLILRNSFQLTIAASIATTIQLALRWQQSENARMEAEAAHAEAELKNLRWQMNPHFMLNTMNNIYALTAIDPKWAQVAIQEFSQLMRHVLYDTQQQVPLSEEIQFMQNYVQLMKIRMQNHVDVQFNIVTPPSSKSVQIAPLIFISLVENAFKHGVSPTSPSFIHINLTTDEDKIVFNIHNSNYPKNEDDQSGHGIGLNQVQRRLSLAYPGRHEWIYGPTEDKKEYHSKITIYLNENYNSNH